MSNLEKNKAAALKALNQFEVAVNVSSPPIIRELLQPSTIVAAGDVDEAVKYLRAEMEKGFYSMKEDQDAIEKLIRAAQQSKKPDCMYSCDADEGKYQKRCVELLEEIAQLKAQQPRQEFTDELIDLLHIMWDGYENGQPCYEFSDDGEQEGFLGNAFQIVDDKECRICEILNKHRPVKTLPSPPKETR